MRQEYLVVGVSDGEFIQGKPEVCTMDEYREKQKATMAATDGNYAWIILTRVTIETEDAEVSSI